MTRTTFRLAALSLLAVLAACEPRPYLPADYAAPAAPPLQPYLGAPAAPYYGPVVRKHVVRRYSRHHYRRYHRRVHCRCAPVK